MTKEARIYNGEKTASSISVAGKATCTRMKLEHSLTPHTQMNSKQIKHLNVRPDTIKLLEENTGRTLFDINHGDSFLEPSSKVKEIKAKINR